MPTSVATSNPAQPVIPFRQEGIPWVVLYKSPMGTPFRIEFPVNPEDMEHDKPTRLTTTDTLTGAYQEVWGKGIEHITFAGNTGWRQMKDGAGDGAAIAYRLMELHRTWQNDTALYDPEHCEMYLVVAPYSIATQAPANDTSSIKEGVYRVSSDDLRVQRNRASPLLWRYRWSMTILRDMLNATANPTDRFQYRSDGNTSTPPSGGGGGGAAGFTSNAFLPAGGRTFADIPTAAFSVYQLDEGQSVDAMMASLDIPTSSRRILAADNQLALSANPPGGTRLLVRDALWRPPV